MNKDCLENTQKGCTEAKATKKKARPRPKNPTLSEDAVPSPVSGSEEKTAKRKRKLNEGEEDGTSRACKKAKGPLNLVLDENCASSSNTASCSSSTQDLKLSQEEAKTKEARPRLKRPAKALLEDAEPLPVSGSKGKTAKRKRELNEGEDDGPSRPCKKAKGSLDIVLYKDCASSSDTASSSSSDEHLNLPQDDAKTNPTKKKAKHRPQSPAKTLSEEAGPSSGSGSESKTAKRKRKLNEEKEDGPSRACKKAKGLLRQVLDKNCASSSNNASCSSSSSTERHKSPKGDAKKAKATKKKAKPRPQSPAKTLSEEAGPSSGSGSESKTAKRKRKLNEEKEDGPSRACKKAKGLLRQVLDKNCASSSNNASCSSSSTERRKLPQGDAKKNKKARRRLKSPAKTLSEEVDLEDRASRASNKSRGSEDLSLNDEGETMRVSVQFAATLREFEAKYTQESPLGEGGFGSVFAGFRNQDNLPVAIKHVPTEKVAYESEESEIPLEVAIMLKLQAGSSGPAGTSAPVTLLDWYKLEEELILVLERPESAVELSDYVMSNGGGLREDKAKVILKQLVDAAMHLQENGVFHGDIKAENILIEAASETLRLRLIDFGASCFCDGNMELDRFCAAKIHIPPEVTTTEGYSTGPGTVWQIGVVMYEILHDRDFVTRSFLRKKLGIRRRLSKKGRDFLNKCLAKHPCERPTLDELQNHGWFA